MLSNCEVCGVEYDSEDLYRGMCSDCLSDNDAMFKAILENPVPKKKRKYDDEKKEWR